MYIPALKQALYEVILDSGIQQRFKDQSVAKVIKQKRNTQFWFKKIKLIIINHCLLIYSLDIGTVVSMLRQVLTLSDKTYNIE